MSVNIVASRIDDRLIHGQGLAWLTSLPINLVVVISDAVAESEIEQDLMMAIIPNSIGARFFTVKKTIEIIHKASDQQKIFLIFKSIKDVLTCIQGGVPINELNIGNIRKKKDTQKISPYVNLQKVEFGYLREIKKLGVRFNSKQTPMGEARGENIDFEKILAKYN